LNAFLWRSHKYTNTVFRLGSPVYDMDTYTFTLVYSQNWLNMNRIPYAFNT